MVTPAVRRQKYEDTTLTTRTNGSKGGERVCLCLRSHMACPQELYISADNASERIIFIYKCVFTFNYLYIYNNSF